LKGKALQDNLPQQAWDLDRQLFASLSLAEKAGLSEMVDRWRHNLEENLNFAIPSKEIDQTEIEIASSLIY